MYLHSSCLKKIVWREERSREARCDIDKFDFLDSFFNFIKAYVNVGKCVGVAWLEMGVVWGGVGDSVGGYITQAKTGTKGTPLSIPFKQYFMKT